MCNEFSFDNFSRFCGQFYQNKLDSFEKIPNCIIWLNTLIRIHWKGNRTNKNRKQMNQTKEHIEMAEEEKKLFQLSDQTLWIN